MASARARLGAAVSAALALTLLPALTAPASAVVTSDTDTSIVTGTSVTASTLTTTTLSTSTTSVTTTAAATFTLPSSRTGYVRLSAAAKADPVVRGRAAAQTAARFAGIRYVAGGTSPATGFDCSGYTRYVYSRLGISLPRVSRDQYAWAIPIARSKAVKGDLVFFYSSSGRIYHVAIYAGNGYIWHSPYPGKRVMLERIWTSSWKVARVRV
ncbi:MAG: C40 family peptidase [Candidatus Nanopelagicales bacterium]